MRRLLIVADDPLTGHAIRLAIAGVDAGVFDAPLPASPLIYDVLRDRSHGSRIELPTYPTVRPHPSAAR